MLLQATDPGKAAKRVVAMANQEARVAKAMTGLTGTGTGTGTKIAARSSRRGTQGRCCVMEHSCCVSVSANNFTEQCLVSGIKLFAFFCSNTSCLTNPPQPPPQMLSEFAKNASVNADGSV